MAKKRFTKKQISFAVSVAVCAIGGAYAFLSDAVNTWKEDPITIIDTSDVEQAKEIIHSVGEVLGDANPIGFDESAMNAINNADTSGKIVRVVDGDTPESVAPDTYRKDNTEEGKTVSDIVRDKLKAGDTVLIEYDVKKEDKYGRTLAYVYMSNGTMVEEWLLSEGLANTATYPPNVKYSDHFQELAHNAWENEVGLWKDFFSEEP